jgi:tungstate transport system substrate-binding protein
MGTYLKYKTDGLISLAVLVEQTKDLLNVYSAIVVNQTSHPSVNFVGAITFMKFLISDEGQQMIELYGNEQYGQSLFYPTIQLLKENTDPTTSQMIEEYAFFNGTECPPEYRIGYPELYD